MGRRDALLTVVGNTAGLYLQVIAVALGVGAIVEASVEVYTLLKFAGAAYLVYLGVQAIRHRRVLPTTPAAAAMPTRPHRGDGRQHMCRPRSRSVRTIAVDGDRPHRW